MSCGARPGGSATSTRRSESATRARAGGRARAAAISPSLQGHARRRKLVERRGEPSDELGLARRDLDRAVERVAARIARAAFEQDVEHLHHLGGAEVDALLDRRPPRRGNGVLEASEQLLQRGRQPRCGRRRREAVAREVEVRCEVDIGERRFEPKPGADVRLCRPRRRLVAHALWLLVGCGERLGLLQLDGLSMLVDLPREQLCEVLQVQLLEDHQLGQDRGVELDPSAACGATTDAQDVQEPLQLARVPAQAACEDRRDLVRERERPLEAVGW